MNIVCIPYHDWRKIATEGARTRDAHIMNHLMKRGDVEHMVIVNRPISYTELYFKKRNQPIKGKLLFKSGGASLYELHDKVYLIDFINKDLLAPLYKKKKWFFESFAENRIKEVFDECLDFLKLEIDLVFSQNVFAAGFVKKFTHSVFDAWDNFIRFPGNKYINNALKEAYQTYAKVSDMWITNSQENLDYYRSHYQPRHCEVIKNGVDVESFVKKYKIPADLSAIPRPIIGFGGKITHLFNYEYFNYTVQQHPDKSFVIVGQILDRAIFNKIVKTPNVFYLGDKHYELYKAYVTNFDIGIVPYVTRHFQHGGDSIKMYEYLAAGLEVVGTPGGGLADMATYLYIADTPEKFAAYIDVALTSNATVSLPEDCTWRYKTAEICNIFNKIMN